MEKTFTPKQRKFFEYIAQGFSRTEAAKKANYAAPRASAQANIQKYTQAFREAFAIAGYTMPDIVQDMVDGTKAMRTVSAINTGKDANAGSLDYVDVPDWNARHKFIDSIIKLQDYYPSEKHEHAGKDGGPIILKWT